MNFHVGLGWSRLLITRKKKKKLRKMVELGYFGLVKINKKPDGDHLGLHL